MRGKPPLDLLILGSGVAGLSAAVRAADSGDLKVGVLTKGPLDQATTRWAQGGIAAVLGDTPDSTEAHMADTLAAGAGLCDADAVRILVDEGPARVKELIELGAAFDRDADGALELAREGGHSHARVVHAGGAATGLEVERALVAAVRQRVTALYERWFACDLLVENGRCVGVTSYPPAHSAYGDASSAAHPQTPAPIAIPARHVLVATGGAGQLFAVTTNPAEATGDGIAMALRAGVAVADVEFVQFHPTALHHPVRPRPLLSEALRGHGALLRDANGERFVDEMLPRDRVSRAITERMLGDDVDHVWLDATGVRGFDERFPTIAAMLSDAGLDPTRDWLPVAPAAHYMCGGIVTDLDGASSLPGLWAAGEVACGGVHGANRLASNSLLDGMVFGARVVDAIAGTPAMPDARRDRPVAGAGSHPAAPAGAGPVTETHSPTAAGASADSGLWPRRHPPRPTSPSDPPTAWLPALRNPPPTGHVERHPSPAAPLDQLAELRERLQRVMTTKAGVVRSAESLEEASATASAIEAAALQATSEDAHDERARRELLNLAIVGRAVCWAAAARRETRGAHTRSDYPDTAEGLRRRFVVWSGRDSAEE